MNTFLTIIVSLLTLIVILFPISGWSNTNLQESEPASYDPCSNVNCNAVRDYIEGLKKAVKTENKNEVASYMSFPLSINKSKHGKTIHYLIKDKNKFIAQYNTIMTKQVKENILNSNEKNIIANYQGIGIANGTLWLKSDTPPITAFVVNVE